MSKEIKAGRLLRDFHGAAIEVKREADKPTTLTFPASSEAPVDRWFGTEILSHEKGAMRMDRLDGGAVPLLFNHDWGDPIGMIDKGALRDGRLMVDAHLFATARATEVQAMIDGGLRNVSIGYQLNTVEEDVKTNTFRATDWGLLEVSVVTIPADPSVGIGRSDDYVKSVRIISEGQPAKPATITGAIMAEVQTATAGAAADTKQDEQSQLSAMEYERQRKSTIINLGKMADIDERSVAQWIQRGTALEVVSKEILDIQSERSKIETSASAIGLSKGEGNRYSMVRVIRALHYGARDPRVMQEAAFEMECSDAVAKKIGRSNNGSFLVPAEVLTRPISTEAATRAMATQPGAKGGYMVNVDNMGFIDILRNRSVAMRMGARQLSGLTGNVMFPRQTGKVTVTWQAGEGTSVTAADQALGQLSMTPKTCIAITDVSEQLLRQASPSAEAFIMADLAADVAIDGVDNAVINGLGGNQPLGIKNTTGITSGQDAASATYAKVLAFVSTAGALNAIRGNPGWVTTTAGAARLMQVQRFTSTDTPVWTGNMLEGQLVGFNAMSSEQLASGNLIFGSWDEVVIGDWGVLELSTDNGGTRFNQAQVGVRALWMVDVLVRYPQAFVVSTNLS
jgi:HK97 family phage major capsid protein/HK97 family phage prohead protease